MRTLLIGLLLGFPAFANDDEAKLERADLPTRRLVLSALKCDLEATLRDVTPPGGNPHLDNPGYFRSAVRLRAELEAINRRLKRYKVSPLACGGKVAALAACMSNDDAHCGKIGEVFTAASTVIFVESSLGDKRCKNALRDWDAGATLDKIAYTYPGLDISDCRRTEVDYRGLGD